MTKNDIVNALNEAIFSINKADAYLAVDIITSVMARALKSGKNIYLRGFGTFYVQEVKQKIGRDINRGSAIIIPAHRTVKFKVSKQIKNAL